MITDQERMKTDAVFVDTVIRECAQLSIQHESDKLKIEELTHQFEDLVRQLEEGKINNLQVAVVAPADDANIMQQRLAKAKHQIEWLMKGGDPCRLCANRPCKMGEVCKPVWKEGADL